MDQGSQLAVAKTLGDWNEELGRVCALLQAYARWTCELLRDRKEQDFRFRWVEGRVKQFASVVRNLEKLDGATADDIWVINDLIGVRVVVVTHSDVRLLAEHLLSDEASPMKRATPQEFTDPEGYRALHIKGWYEGSSLKVGCEIQIRNEIQDGFAVVTRADMYGHESELPESLVAFTGSQGHSLLVAENALEFIRRQSQQQHKLSQQEPTKPESNDVSTAEKRQAQANAPDTGIEASLDRPQTEKDIQEEEFIIRAPISDRRVHEFLESVKKDRPQAGALEWAFERAGAVQIRSSWDEASAYGFNLLLHKGPFVEGSSWIRDSTWSFSLALERYLLGKMEALLVESTGSRPAEHIPLAWPSVELAVRRLVENASTEGYEPSLIVVAGDVGSSFWAQTYRRLAFTQPRITWISGIFEGLPILQIQEASQKTIYVVDIRRFAELTRNTLDVQLMVDSIDHEKAETLLQTNPDLVAIPPGRPRTHDERLRQLQLKVWVRLFESSALKLQDSGAAWRGLLDAP